MRDQSAYRPLSKENQAAWKGPAKGPFAIGRVRLKDRLRLEGLRLKDRLRLDGYRMSGADDPIVLVDVDEMGLEVHKLGLA